MATGHDVNDLGGLASFARYAGWQNISHPVHGLTPVALCLSPATRAKESPNRWHDPSLPDLIVGYGKV